MFAYLLIFLGLFNHIITTYGAVQRLTSAEIDVWKQKEEISVLMVIKKSCTDCDKKIKAFEDLSEIFGQFVTFAIVDSEGISTNYRSSKYPAIKILEKSVEKPTDYEKDITVEALSSYLLKMINKLVKDRFTKKGYTKKDTYVITLGVDNFTQTISNSEENWLVEFFAPWCGHCKALAPAWKEAAKRLDGKMKLAAVDATVSESLARSFGIQGFPTIKFIPARSQNLESSAVDYNGGRSADDIVRWAETKIKPVQPPAELIQIASYSHLEERCLNKILCVLSFLPNKLDSNSKEWNRYITILKEVSAKVLKDDTNGWAWVEGTIYEDLEEMVGVGGFGYPALVVIRHSKHAYSPLKGPFTVEGIKDFINNLGTKSVSILPLAGEVPKIKDTERWDGKEFGNSDL